MKVIIMRGIMGSGKTTWLSKNYPGAVVCSADLAHTTGGVYKFDPARKDEAHRQCLRTYLGFIHELKCCQPEVLAVDNTNLTAWEAAPYVRLAELYGIEYEIITIWCDPITAAKRNVHDVPPERMMAAYHQMLTERLPGHWRQRVILGESL
jgi:predicted kinase